MKKAIFCSILYASLLCGPAQAQTTYTVSYTYDAQGRLTKAAYEGDLQFTYTYDTNNNLLSKVVELPTGVAVEEDASLPIRFAILANYPNPFNPITTIRFDLPETAEVRVEVIDLLGRRVLEVPAQAVSAGAGRSLKVDASALASGLYFYRVLARAGTRMMVDTGQMVLVK